MGTRGGDFFYPLCRNTLSVTKEAFPQARKRSECGPTFRDFFVFSHLTKLNFKFKLLASDSSTWLVFNFLVLNLLLLIFYNSGQNCLHLASVQSYLSLVENMVDLGADVDSKVSHAAAVALRLLSLIWQKLNFLI